MTMQVGWIGLGKMGEPMALNIHRAGHDLTVWNRSAQKCESLRSAGTRVARDIQDLASSVDVVFVIVADDAAVRQVVLGEGGALSHMREGSTLVEMSTISVALSAEVASAAEERGVRYLRAPVSGSVILAAAGQLIILASGPRNSFDALVPVLETMTAQQVYAGDGEQARILKLSINMMVGITAAMMGEAMALCLKYGVDRTTMLDVMGASVIASPLVGYKLDALKARDYSPKFDVGQITKDFDLALNASRSSDTPVPLTALVREGWSAMIAAGDGEEDFFKYVEHSARAAGVDDT